MIFPTLWGNLAITVMVKDYTHTRGCLTLPLPTFKYTSPPSPPALYFTCSCRSKCSQNAFELLTTDQQKQWTFYATDLWLKHWLLSSDFQKNSCTCCANVCMCSNQTLTKMTINVIHISRSSIFGTKTNKDLYNLEILFHENMRGADLSASSGSDIHKSATDRCAGHITEKGIGVRGKKECRNVTLRGKSYWPCLFFVLFFFVNAIILYSLAQHIAFLLSSKT